MLLPLSGTEHVIESRDEAAVRRPDALPELGIEEPAVDGGRQGDEAGAEHQGRGLEAQRHAVPTPSHATPSVAAPPPPPILPASLALPPVEVAFLAALVFSFPLSYPLHFSSRDIFSQPRRLV